MFSHTIDAQLSLQLIHPNHAAELFSLIKQDREALARWLVWPNYLQSEDDYRAFVTRSLQEHAQQQSLVCTMFFDGKAVGTLSFITIDLDLQKAELGYWLADQYQGQGIASRACRALIELGFKALGLTKIEASVAVENQASRALCERLGMSVEGVISQDELLNGQLVDHAKYALFKNSAG